MENMNPTGLVDVVSKELENIRPVPLHDGIEFPFACRAVLRSIPGNSNCIDCGAPGPDWASVSFGCLLCLQCSGRHRSYGVKTSFVRSITMDAWSHSQVLAMLEGGNDQLARFFDRHRMGNQNGAGTVQKRYLTKAARFYRINLVEHVNEVSAAGIYQGREMSRRKNHQTQTNNTQKKTSYSQQKLVRQISSSRQHPLTVQ